MFHLYDVATYGRHDVVLEMQQSTIFNSILKFILQSQDLHHSNIDSDALDALFVALDMSFI